MFGLPFDQKQYSKALYACDLELDLREMQDGDLRKATGLSGGQKAVCVRDNLLHIELTCLTASGLGAMHLC